jgi:hypothetical protein
MLEDLGIGKGSLGERKAGMLPYLALALGVVVVVVADMYFQLPAA